MRVLSVRFKNLNSILGEWKIDFTHPAYSSDGIFAITGPTGAGKTTVLDAICLALYGRTPRLKDVTQSENEVMSRHTGECFAELVFEASAGSGGVKQYAAFWEQHRARKFLDGALQQIRHEIADIGLGRVLETRQRHVAEKIKEVTGLSYDQFVRSILLAQGGFAAFLQSPPGERSPILEQITGTEIYSQLSMRAHEIRNTERSALIVLEAEVGNLKNLEPEDVEALRLELAAKEKEASQAERDLKRCGAELEWLEGMAVLQKELDALEDRDRDLSRRREGFEMERRRLERAQTALEFGSTHAALLALRREQETEKKALFECQAKTPELEANVRRAEDALQMARSVLAERQMEQKKLLELLRTVRELDLKQREKASPIRDIQESADDLARAAEEVSAKLNADRLRFEAEQVRFRDVGRYLQDNAADERLIEQFAEMRTRFDVLTLSTEKRRRLERERVEAEKRKQDTQNLLNGQNVLLDTVKMKCASTENVLRKEQAGLVELLAHRPLAEWRGSLTDLAGRVARQERIAEVLGRRTQTAAERGELKARCEALDVARREGLWWIQEQEVRVREAEREVRLLETQTDLIRRIRDLEEARGGLREGQPCPLCGSIEHPYASGALPDGDETQSALERARRELSLRNEALSTQRVENARLGQELRQLEEEDSRLQIRLKAEEDQLAEGLSALQMVLPMDADPLTAIEWERKKTEEVLQRTRLAVERAEKIDQNLRVIQDGLEQMREERDHLTRSQQEAEFAKEAAAREWNRLVQETRICEEEHRNIRLGLARQVSPYGYRNLPDERPEQVLTALETRMKRWQEQHRLSLDLEKRLSVWERDLQHGQDSLQSLSLALKEKQQVAKALKAEKDAIRQQRVSLFGEKAPEVEEAAQTELVNAALEQVEAKRAAREAALQEALNMHSRIEELGKAIHIRSDRLQKTEVAFKRQLAENGFIGEDAYLAACLSEVERKVLQERAQALDSERTELDTRRLDRKFALEEQRRRQLTDSTLDDIRDRAAQAASAQRELQQEVGALRSRLEGEEELSQKRGERAAVLKRQRQESQRWERLHDLIGSADGQKYRNFAQGLTFEMVLRHANHQLRKMTDRYMLTRDGDLSLELKVIDNYQAGEVRSAKNLSGGESFIVSLALALGLSQMASRKVRVDSLFLDEGFGTLDEEALDMALSTLTSLRREGKLIGIISHVDALKERIAAQIEVIPQGNGRSIIQAPGCIRLSD
ncbi:MAG: AAA family ATPase [Synergistaceae bacterium]|jgi:exonuclease SbcC|nr:AAA family ATPase [Synergistaceae bacterium]